MSPVRGEDTVVNGSLKSSTIMPPFEGPVWTRPTFCPFVITQDFTGRKPSRYISPRIHDILEIVRATHCVQSSYRHTLLETLVTAEKSMTLSRKGIPGSTGSTPLN